jgi:hypothetical protein
MTGIPTQTAESIRATPDYLRGMYERVGNDKRLLTFLSPMAPFLDPGSHVFDNPDKYGYTLKAKTLEEHRQLLIQPSWKYIVNYESDCLTTDEMVDATYDAAVGINTLKAGLGIIPADMAAATEVRIGQAKVMMAKIDEAMTGDPLERERRLEAVREEVDRLNESTVCQKSELNWPARLAVSMVVNVVVLWFVENIRILGGLVRGRFARADHQEA